MHLLFTVTVQKPVSNATSRSNSNTSSMAHCECDVSYTLSSSTPGEPPIRGLMGRIERSPVIGASCYLLTTATRLAGPLFPHKTGNMCARVGLLRCTCACMCERRELYLYANACLRVHVCYRKCGGKYLRGTRQNGVCVCVKEWRTVLTLNMWPYVRSGHVCGNNP